MTPALLAVHAHPDDETLWTGALLATYVARGWRVGVVTATRGEMGEVIGQQWAHLEGDGPALAAHREQELAQALVQLGVPWHRFLDSYGNCRIEDSGMSWVSPGVAGPAPTCGPKALVASSQAQSLLAAAVADFRPDVLVTYAPDGGYGHPDHVRVHEMVMALPAGYTIAWATNSQLAAGRQAIGRLPLGRFLAPHAQATWAECEYNLPSLQVPFLPVRDQVIAALGAHATQVQAVETLDLAGVWGRYALSDGVWAPLLDETYAIAAGDLQLLSWGARD